MNASDSELFQRTGLPGTEQWMLASKNPDLYVARHGAEGSTCWWRKKFKGQLDEMTNSERKRRYSVRAHFAAESISGEGQAMKWWGSWQAGGECTNFGDLVALLCSFGVVFPQSCTRNRGAEADMQTATCRTSSNNRIVHGQQIDTRF